MTEPSSTVPYELDIAVPEETVVVAPFYKDPATGELFVHRDLFRARAAWEEEAHVGPVRASEKFGDPASFAAYVRRYGVPATTFTRWNKNGVSAFLDYHTADVPNRAQWTAHYTFVPTPAWEAWSKFTDGHPINQAAAIAFLEDRAPEVLEPAPVALLPLLRALKAYSHANAETEYRENGTAKVTFNKDQGVRGAEVELPAEIEIGIPIYRGHPDVLRLVVRVRVTVDDNAKLAFRFTIPRAEEVLEQLREELVAKVAEQLGTDYPILRAAD
jgi:uncharacterized protein YfdQ (DUF2303 family)